MDKSIKKKEDLHISHDVKSPEQRDAEVSADLKKHGLAPTESVEIRDPLSGEKKIISLDRTGTTEKNLIQVLADPDLTRDRKDFALSMYLYERGAHGMSMITDLMRYKGAHTKETHVFKQQMRFDFESFVSMFAKTLRDKVVFAREMLGVDIEKEREDFYSFVRERKELDRKDAEERKEDYIPKRYTYLDYFLYAHKEHADEVGRLTAYQIALAIHDYETAVALEDKVRLIAETREKEKGKGIYVDKMGRPYTMDDPHLEEVIKADREAAAQAETL